ncbi:hypothetical protein E4U44_001601 [Claviceps purpurea]|nr:hypothetical protein E4U44_001601 [Claviceps purpurea]
MSRHTPPLCQSCGLHRTVSIVVPHTPPLLRRLRRSKGKPDETPTSRPAKKTPCSFSAWQSQAACLSACPLEQQCSCCTLTNSAFV